MNIINDVLVDKLFPDKPKRTKEIPLLEEKSVSGESIIIRDAYPDMPFNGLHVYGKSTQVTTKGEQLFNVDAGGRGWIKPETGEFMESNSNYVSGFISVKNSTQYYCNYNTSPYVYSYDAEKHFLRKETYNGNFITNSDVFFIRFAISADKEVALSKAKKIMLCEGDVEKPYEPYTGGKPSPSIEYPQEIDSTGDNGEIGMQIFATNLFDNKKDYDSNHVQVSEDGYEIIVQNESQLNEVVKLGTITLKAGRYYISAERVSHKETEFYMFFDGGWYSTHKIGIGEKEIVIKKDGKYTVKLAVSPNVSVKIGGLMISKVKQAKYEPYKEPQKLTLSTPNGLLGIPVSTGGNYTDANRQQWICDEIDFGCGKYIQRVEKVNFDGSADESWKVSVSPVGNRYVWILLNNRAESKYDDKITCNIALPRTWNAKNFCFINEYEYFSYHDSSAPASIFENVDNFKQWLIENPIEILYKLETPIERDLTPEEIAAYKALHTNYPTTVIMNDENAGMKVTYLTPSFIPTRESELRMWFKENPII